MIAAEVIQGARSLARLSGFYAVSVLTLALAIGASTAVFSLFDHIVLRALPFAEPEQLVRIDKGATQAEYVAMRDRMDGFAAVSAYTPTSGWTLSGSGQPQRIQASRISSNLFQALGLSPIHGRDFRSPEDVSGADRVALVSERFWRQHLGGQAGAIGQLLVLDGQAYEVIGVMPSDVRFPDDEVEVWVPVAIESANPGVFWSSGNLRVIARLHSTTSVEVAQAELEVVARALRLENPLWTPDETGYVDSFRVVAMKDLLIGPVATPLAALMVAVVLLLLMACVNLSNLFLARSLERNRDFAVRASLGAGTARLVGSSLVELTLIVIPGALLGLGLAWFLTVRIPSLLPSDVPVLAGLGVDGRVLGFALLTTIVAALISGVLPAIRAARGNTAGALASGRQGGDIRTSRISQSMVAVQITLAVILSIGAGLALKTLAAFSNIDPGFEPANVVTARLDPVPDPLRSPAAVRSMQESLIERVRALPEIRQAGLTSVAPLEGIGSDFTAFDILHDRQDQGRLPQAHFPHTSPGYLEAMGVELIDGRLFDATDGNDSVPVAVVSRSLAERYFTDGNAVGGQIGQPWSDSWWTVVGVVEDVYYEALDRSGQFAIYRPLAQAPRETVVLAVKTPADFGTVASAITSIVNDLDVEVAVSRLQTGKQRLTQSIAQPRFYGQLLAAFATAAVLLVVLGIHGTTARMVGRRRREIGIRVAVGATPVRLFRFIISNVLALTAAGLLVGLAAAMLSTRWLEAMLFGVESLDATTFVIVSAMILAASMLSATLPVLRAMRISPAEVLSEQ